MSSVSYASSPAPARAKMSKDEREQLLASFASSFLGTQRQDPVLTPVDGELSTAPRIYLDSGATTLMPRLVIDGARDYAERACANSHSQAHRAARDTTKAIDDSRAAMGRLVGADPTEDIVLFTANGATGATNFLARALFPPEMRSVLKRFNGAPPAELVSALRDGFDEVAQEIFDQMMERPLVVTTEIEHHSNFLPWVAAVGHENIRVVPCDRVTGALDMDALHEVFEKEGHRIRLVATIGASNVTGVFLPVHDIAKLAHSHGAQILVDGAQWVPHAKVDMHPADPAAAIDYLALSGHKLYAPGSRGALIGKLSGLLKARCVTDVGGGAVEFVSIDDFMLKADVTDREEAGTPNIPGSIAMGLVAEVLERIDMDLVQQHEQARLRLLMQELTSIEGVTVVGDNDVDKTPRAGVVAFAAFGLDHRLVAHYLNDFHNIAVRDGCFCAQPYVQALLNVDDDFATRVRAEMIAGDRTKLPGLVRASLGIYNTDADVKALGTALRFLKEHKDLIVSAYTMAKNGTHHAKGADALGTTFGLSAYVSAYVDEAVAGNR